MGTQLTKKIEDQITGTSVDLAEDLLAEPTEAYAPLEVATPTDDPMQNARILRQEGFFEEAKHLLHQILVHDPGRVDARKMLSEIHHQECDDLFKSAAPPPLPSRKNPDLIIDQLISDLDIDMSSLIAGETLTEWRKHLALTSSRGSFQDALDLAVAFYEMGAFELSVEVIRGSIDSDSQARLGKQFLLAANYLSLKKEMDTILICDEMIGDRDYPWTDKIHFVYLKARAFESMNKYTEAKKQYDLALSVDPNYRDTQVRLKFLAG